MKDRAFWSCASCSNIGSIPKEERFRTDAFAMSEALNASHRQSQPLSDAGHPLCTEKVEYVPEWVIEGILREANKDKEHPRYQIYEVANGHLPPPRRIVRWHDISAANDKQAEQELQRMRKQMGAYALWSLALYKDGRMVHGFQYPPQ